MRWLSRLVTIAVILAVVGVAALAIRSRLPETKFGQQFTAWALFRDGSRLAVGSPVVIAGVRVGEVTKLTVVGDLARVDMRMRDDVQIPIDSWITKRAESAFGDSYLEIVPSNRPEGAAPVRLLRSGEQIVRVEEGGSTDTVLRAIARGMPKIDRGLDTVHDFALDGRRWANGTLEEGIANVDRWLAEGNLDKPIASADRAVASFEDGTQRAADAVAGAKPDIGSGLDRLDRGVASARKQMGDLKQSLQSGFHDARDGMDRVDKPIQQVADVLAAVNEGRGSDAAGTFGRLVNDPHLAEEISDTTEGLREATGGLDRLKSWLGLRAEWNVFSNAARVYITAEIRARDDKFYLVELEKGPLGAVPADQLTDVVNAPQYNRYQQISDTIRFTLQFGKRFGHLQLRGGIKESTFGAGADVLLDRVWLSGDVFGAFQPVPRLKLTGQLRVFRSAYLIAGADDILNKPGYLPLVLGNSPVPDKQLDHVRYGRDYFFGATLHFDDADLGTILRVYGALILGLLK